MRVSRVSLRVLVTRNGRGSMLIDRCPYRSRSRTRAECSRADITCTTRWSSTYPSAGSVSHLPRRQAPSKAITLVSSVATASKVQR